MLLIPFPFTVSLVLVFLLAQMTWRAGQVAVAQLRLRQLLGGYALLSVLVGLRWGHGIAQVAPLQATLAVGLVAWALRCYQRLAADAPASPWQRLHLLPTLGVAALAVGWPPAVEAAVALVYLGYGVALLRLARRGPPGGHLALRMRRWVGWVAVCGLLSALVAAGMAGGLAHSLGRYSGWLLGGWQMLALLVWGAAASAAAEHLPPPHPTDGRQTAIE